MPRAINMSIPSALFKLRPVLGRLARLLYYLAVATSVMWIRPFPISPSVTLPAAESLPDILGLIRQTVTSQNLQQRIDQAFTEQDFESVKSYQGLAIAAGIDLDHARIAAELDQHDTVLSNMVQNSENFLQGAVFGEGDSIAHLAGSATADLLIIGDIRDLIIASDHYLTEQEVDYFTVGLSVIGLATSAVAMASSGAASSLDISTSVLKIAKKTGNISQHFAVTVVKQLDNTFNIKAMLHAVKEINARDMTFFEKSVAFKQEFAKLIKQTDPAKLDQLRSLMKNIEIIAESTNSFRKTLAILKQADTAEELEKFAKLSKRFPEYSDSIVKILGKRAIKILVLPSISALYYAARIGYWGLCQLAWLIAFILPVLLGRYWGSMSLLVLIGVYWRINEATVQTWLLSLVY